MIKRAGVSMEKLKTVDTYPAKIPESGSLPMWNFKPTGPVEGAVKKLTSGFSALSQKLQK